MLLRGRARPCGASGVRGCTLPHHGLPPTPHPHSTDCARTRDMPDGWPAATRGRYFYMPRACGRLRFDLRLPATTPCQFTTTEPRLPGCHTCRVVGATAPACHEPGDHACAAAATFLDHTSIGDMGMNTCLGPGTTTDCNLHPSPCLPLQDSTGALNNSNVFLDLQPTIF